MLEYRRVPISKYSIGDICPNLRNKNPISPSTNTATTNRATYYKRSYSSYSSSQQSKPKMYNSFELHEQKSLLLLHHVIYFFYGLFISGTTLTYSMNIKCIYCCLYISK